MTELIAVSSACIHLERVSWNNREKAGRIEIKKEEDLECLKNSKKIIKHVKLEEWILQSDDFYEQLPKIPSLKMTSLDLVIDCQKTIPPQLEKLKDKVETIQVQIQGKLETLTQIERHVETLKSLLPKTKINVILEAMWGDYKMAKCLDSVELHWIFRMDFVRHEKAFLVVTYIAAVISHKHLPMFRDKKSEDFQFAKGLIKIQIKTVTMTDSVCRKDTTFGKNPYWRYIHTYIIDNICKFSTQAQLEIAG